MSEKKPQLLIFRVIQARAAVLNCSAPDKSVLIQLVECLRPEANGTLVWPSQELIAEQTALGDRTVRRAIKQLCDQDLIKLQRTTGRHNVYSINIGLIHRLLETGHTGRSEKADRPHRPVRAATQAGQSGQSDLLTTYEQPRNTEEHFLFGCSKASKVLEDPKQRQLAVLAVVAGAAERMRVDSAEQPTIKKSDDLPVPKTAKDGDP